MIIFFLFNFQTWDELWKTVTDRIRFGLNRYYKNQTGGKSTMCISKHNVRLFILEKTESNRARKKGAKVRCVSSGYGQTVKLH